MKVLVYGGTGSQGGAIVAELVKSGHQPTILTRTPGKVAAASGVHVAAGDLEDLPSLQHASQGMDAIALTISFSIPDEEAAFRQARHAIDAAAQAGVRLIVYNTSGPVLADRIGAPGYDVRPRILAHLKASGVPYIVLKPSTYLENLLGPWTLQRIVESDTLVYPVNTERRVGWMATRDLAALVVSALEHPQLAPAEFIISGHENLNGDDLADRLSKAIGRTIRYQPLALEAFGAALDGMMGPGASDIILPGYRILRDHPERVTNWTDMDAVLQKLPARLTSVEDWARMFLPLFSKQGVADPLP
ncbi:MAG: NmrA family NAD(P)-binding protein [Pleurocapsa minor GSE-CHR-MK-17-07R]|jgi:uncharacterized protein YbjT (DUF2867 family)|nr:NmrA family NAD(P)-binding protein [Pleurocapsa minor GSE-CHR-MK 17-07R]